MTEWWHSLLATDLKPFVYFGAGFAVVQAVWTLNDILTVLRDIRAELRRNR